MDSTKNLLINQWMEQDESVLLLDCLQYLDVASLVQKKQVCKPWNYLCTQAIDLKCKNNKKAFQTSTELKQAVDKYSPGAYSDNRPCTAIDAEDISIEYGYPIDKWDVSTVTNFSFIFYPKSQFNEPIGSWNVSNATSLCCMFYCADSFNQDLSSWDVSNVMNMTHMFYGSTSFNQNISSWNVSHVRNMSSMFHSAHSFTQDVASWSISNDTNLCGIFDNCPIDSEQIPWYDGH